MLTLCGAWLWGGVFGWLTSGVLVNATNTFSRLWTSVAIVGALGTATAYVGAFGGIATAAGVGIGLAGHRTWQAWIIDKCTGREHG
ncbi:hypothetical protein UC34_12230 [Pandoraea vervacti]|uniref:Holin n=1 Tax=Pandoraea vervacti TaxID=656178 RepID=A0ABN4FQV8_9BURK|nr:hypothetical protein UC34_12230 [Pandoraea vervacti]